MSKAHFLRQLMVAASPQLAAISAGGAVTYPGVLLQQLKSNDSGIELNFHSASWIGSIHGLAGIPSILMPSFMQWRGRKVAFIFACLLIVTGWVLAFTASGPATIFICESFHGLGTNSLLAVSLLSLSEMIAPKYRNVAMQMFGVSQSLGMGLVGAMVGFVHWKTISVIMCAPVLLALAIACMWPESPSWLACKGEFDKCTKAFIWLRGIDDTSQKELKALISAQRANLLTIETDNAWGSCPFWYRFTKREFYLPTLHIFLLLNMMYWTGSAVVLIYCVDIIKRATDEDELAHFGGIAINIILFLGVTTSNVLIKSFNNKSILLISTILATICLFCVTVASFLQTVGVLSKHSRLSSYFLIAFMIPNCLGLNCLVFVIGAELMPVRHRSVGGALYVIINCVLLTSTLNLSPYLFHYIDIWGTFLIFSLNGTVTGLLVWKYIPETKGRTLQDIEDYYIYGKFDVRDCDRTRDPDLDMPLVNT